MRLWLLAIAVVAGVAGIDLYAQTAATRVALRGIVITPAGNQSDAAVLIEGQMIAALVPGNAGAISVGGVILPGLIDLHNHYTWNVLPRWTPRVKYGNRYEWQEEA